MEKVGTIEGGRCAILKFKSLLSRLHPPSHACLLCCWDGVFLCMDVSNRLFASHFFKNY